MQETKLNCEYNVPSRSLEERERWYKNNTHSFLTSNGLYLLLSACVFSFALYTLVDIGSTTALAICGAIVIGIFLFYNWAYRAQNSLSKIELTGYQIYSISIDKERILINYNDRQDRKKSVSLPTKEYSLRVFYLNMHREKVYTMSDVKSDVKLHLLCIYKEPLNPFFMTEFTYGSISNQNLFGEKDLILTELGIPPRRKEDEPAFYYQYSHSGWNKQMFLDIEAVWKNIKEQEKKNNP